MGKVNGAPDAQDQRQKRGKFGYKTIGKTPESGQQKQNAQNQIDIVHCYSFERNAEVKLGNYFRTERRPEYPAKKDIFGWAGN